MTDSEKCRVVKRKFVPRWDAHEMTREVCWSRSWWLASCGLTCVAGRRSRAAAVVGWRHTVLLLMQSPHKHQPVNTCPLGTNLDRKKEIRREGKSPAVPSRVDLPADYKPPLGFSISRIFSSTSSQGPEKTVISLDGLKEIGSKFWIR